ncbi:hypothetical protein SS50377_22090 [Spironucleus salmonicida]|uniref:Uncharacterized protein n=1 Tax=Spironucleus salmonicida TaxID=348837 RepID=V6LND9_9EUKA|nr:hypothetical protein SS50377_22090 [Spironucleus salmonicida]|eukprot:EST45748.1 Hypothetical protein SS50377_14319 [Spironucleus salmonicida]
MSQIIFSSVVTLGTRYYYKNSMPKYSADNNTDIKRNISQHKQLLTERTYPPFEQAVQRRCPQYLQDRLQKFRRNYKIALTNFNKSSLKTDPVLNKLKIDTKLYKEVQWQIFDLMRTNILGYEIVDYRYASKDFVTRFNERLMDSIEGQKLILCEQRHYDVLNTTGNFIK